MKDKQTSTDFLEISESMKAQLRQSTGRQLPETTVGDLNSSAQFANMAAKLFAGVSTTVRVFATEVYAPINPMNAQNVAIGRPEYVFSLNRINTVERNDSAKEMLSYLTLQNGWDGLGSVAPSKNAIADAYSFITRLPIQNEIPEPTVYGDGEVGWYWSKGEDLLSMVFTGGGRYAYYGVVDGEEIRSPSREYGDSVPYDLSKAIGNI